MENKILLDTFDVILFHDERYSGINNRLMLVSGVMRKGLNNEKIGDNGGLFSTEGVDCIVLQPEKKWCKGTLRFCLEFIPKEEDEEEPEDEQNEQNIEISPLDDLREKFKQST